MFDLFAPILEKKIAQGRNHSAHGLSFFLIGTSECENENFYKNIKVSY